MPLLDLLRTSTVRDTSVFFTTEKKIQHDWWQCHKSDIFTTYSSKKILYSPARDGLKNDETTLILLGTPVSIDLDACGDST